MGVISELTRFLRQTAVEGPAEITLPSEELPFDERWGLEQHLPDDVRERFLRQETRVFIDAAHRAYPKSMPWYYGYTTAAFVVHPEAIERSNLPSDVIGALLTSYLHWDSLQGKIYLLHDETRIVATEPVIEIFAQVGTKRHTASQRALLAQVAYPQALRSFEGVILAQSSQSWSQEHMRTKKHPHKDRLKAFEITRRQERLREAVARHDMSELDRELFRFAHSLLSCDAVRLRSRPSA